MRYDILQNIIVLLKDFESQEGFGETYAADISGFKSWITATMNSDLEYSEPYWEGKENGRSAESVINTLLVHLNRYAKSYAKAAIIGSDFSTQEDFIYLITLNTFGTMTKMELIKRNVHEKPVGIQIINRLLAQGWIDQTASTTDKRSKVLNINAKGKKALEQQMDNIRKATSIVTGNLSHKEKMELIRLLQKLDDFHLPIYNKNVNPEQLLETALKNIN